MKEPNFEFYVVNYDFNRRECVMYNIFDNIHVYDYCLRHVKRHLRHKKQYNREDLKKDVLQTISWQEWARAEYECSVGDPFPRTVDELKKIDCYWQAEPNIDIIVDMLISRYKEYKKYRDGNE